MEKSGQLLPHEPSQARGKEGPDKTGCPVRLQCQARIFSNVVFEKKEGGVGIRNRLDTSEEKIKKDRQ